MTISLTRVPVDLTSLRLTTREIDDPGDLLALLPDSTDPLTWVHGGDGLVAWGRALTVRTRGRNRFADAEHVWRSVCDQIRVDDEVGLPGTGPVAFTSFAFGDGLGTASVLAVPRVLVGRRDGRSWITTLDDGRDPASLDGPREPVRRPGPGHWREGRMTAAGYRSAVAQAVRRMAGSELDKVVLARDLSVRFARTIDHRLLAGGLSARQPGCWTYSVDGLVGATPELLLRRLGATVESRVLAGTAWPGQDQAAVLAGRKYHDEHRIAVDSLRSTLGPYCAAFDAEGPHAVTLPNVTHLATDVRGVLRGESSLLRLAAAVHPTAAVGGTPPRRAMRTIAELEGRHGLDRGRYAGPVGWVDARGDGELGVALRCAQLSGRTARLYAGCGLVVDSDPDLELAETTAKFRAVAGVLAA